MDHLIPLNIVSMSINVHILNFGKFNAENLVHLEVRCCSVEIFKRLKNIRTLCTECTGDEFKEFEQLSTLQSLTVYCTNNINESHLFPFEKLPGLTYFDITFVGCFVAPK